MNKLQLGRPDDSDTIDKGKTAAGIICLNKLIK